MSHDVISELAPAGSALFSDFDSFLNDLSEEDESMIAGGARSNSNSGRRRPRRKPIRRRRRRPIRNRNRKRNISRT
ncbi:hypothetical protein IQ268_20285 [Oculatella sp. LEGE 06141]|uniref:hypothetical protein n=1 Tax=Oculatella sp. LEGE 06141 TaxID=1828648 RepID=UPI00188034C8|nr:hypothetical protein [Oculatella sp. LEGE 06141]MBE9180901.1 hypothetical protein [Oculatella sp. LEGE 06141]